MHSLQLMFECLHESFPDLATYLDAQPDEVEGRALRSGQGGHLIFRPIGLEIVADSYCFLKKERQLGKDEICELFSALPIDLSRDPYVGLLWNPRKQTILSKSKAIGKRIVRYMLGSNANEETLLSDYIRVLEGVEAPEKRDLPQRIE